MDDIFTLDVHLLGTPHFKFDKMNLSFTIGDVCLKYLPSETVHPSLVFNSLEAAKKLCLHKQIIRMMLLCCGASSHVAPSCCNCSKKLRFSNSSSAWEHASCSFSNSKSSINAFQINCLPGVNIYKYFQFIIEFARYKNVSTFNDIATNCNIHPNTASDYFYSTCNICKKVMLQGRKMGESHVNPTEMDAKCIGGRMLVASVMYCSCLFLQTLKSIICFECKIDMEILDLNHCELQWIGSLL